MGSYKILVTFVNIEEMEIAFKFDYPLNHFNEVCKWSTQEYNHSRRAWIEVFGLSLHAWSPENLRKISSIWGSVISLDKRMH